jgi:hypothetical protein
LYSLYVAYSNSFSHAKLKTNIITKPIKILFVYVLVIFAWIFFRAESVGDAFVYLSKIGEMDFSINLIQICAEKGPLNLLISFLSVGLLLISYLLPNEMRFAKKYQSVLASVVLIFLIILIGVNGKAEFIYFQF